MFELRLTLAGWLLVAGVVLPQTGYVAEPAAFTYQPSGLGFPERIEGRFTRGPVPTTNRTSQRLTVDYHYDSGESVQVSVYPAPSDAKGPTKLDGDQRSGPSPDFERELERSRTELLNGITGSRQVSQMRFHAALHRRGPIGIKETHVAKVNGREVYHALLLCERNGYFVRFTVSYPKELQQQVGLTYTDVANFLLWPDVKPRP